MHRLLVSTSRARLSSACQTRTSVVCRTFGSQEQEQDTSNVWKAIGATVAVSLIGLSLQDDSSPWKQFWKKSAQKFKDSYQAHALEDAQDNLMKRFGLHRPELPSYKLSEIVRHNNKESRIWVAFQSGVYDVTDFVDQHPGGDAIMMAAGSNLEPFWAIYANHKTEQVLNILESYRIGNLDAEDVLSSELNESGASMDPFAKDPIRHAALKVHTKKPFNAETPVILLDKQFLTPNELFFVRHHLPVPEVDLHEYELEISGFGLKQPVVLTYDELQRLPQHKVITTIQCAGNRRNEMFKIRTVKGLEWTEGAISTAEWTGVRLVDLLQTIGADLSRPEIKHIQADGLDLDPSSKPYGASIPAETALDPKSDVLLALKMNGQTLPRDHGFPVRLIVPGVVGARNVKWLSALRLANEESDSHWQQADYKGFHSQIDYDNVDFSKGYSIQSMPVQSAICSPSNNQQVTVQSVKQNGNKLSLSGYAWSGGGRRIVRVDISLDNGKTWSSANLLGEPEYKKHVELDQLLRSGVITEDEYEHRRSMMFNEPMDQSFVRSWAWTLWSLDVQLSEEQLKAGRSLQIVCKALDNHYNGQPETVDHLWNFRGVLNNAWHRVNVQFQ